MRTREEAAHLVDEHVPEQPGKVRVRLVTEVAGLLAEGVDHEHIGNRLHLWSGKRLGVGLLAELVGEAMRAPVIDAARCSRISRTDERVTSAFALAGYSLGECNAATLAHAKTSSQPITPAEIIGRVRSARRSRMDREVVHRGTPPTGNAPPSPPAEPWPRSTARWAGSARPTTWPRSSWRARCPGACQLPVWRAVAPEQAEQVAPKPANCSRACTLARRAGRPPGRRAGGPATPSGDRSMSTTTIPPLVPDALHLACHGEPDAGRQPDLYLHGPEGQTIVFEVKNLRRRYTLDHEREAALDVARDVVQEVNSWNALAKELISSAIPLFRDHGILDRSPVFLDGFDEIRPDELRGVPSVYCLVVSTQNDELFNGEPLPPRCELAARLHVRVVSPVEALAARTECWVSIFSSSCVVGFQDSRP